jgi:hypothetical protein
MRPAPQPDVIGPPPKLHELRDNLRQVVAPDFDVFNAYIDEYVDCDEPYEATVLGSLAEDAMEAALELERRTGSYPRSSG